jgi:hypothetical protein
MRGDLHQRADEVAENVLNALSFAVTPSLAEAVCVLINVKTEPSRAVALESEAYLLAKNHGGGVVTAPVVRENARCVPHRFETISCGLIPDPPRERPASGQPPRP